MNNLLKKPTKGGTPAIEKSKIVRVNKLKLVKLKLLKEWSVLNFVKITLNNVQNNKINEVL